MAIPKQRRIMIGALQQPREGGRSWVRVPFIRLTRKWLADAEFSEGDRIDITVVAGEIRLAACQAKLDRRVSQGELF
jgi:hypothetical protein